MYIIKETQCCAEDRFLVFRGFQLLVRGEQHLWSRDDLRSAGVADFACLLIERGECGSTLAALISETEAARLSAESVSTRALLLRTGQGNFALIGQGTQLINWYESHRYCGACGSPTSAHPAQRALVCTACQACYYPRINPCVIVLVTDGDQVLLARNSRSTTGFFSCLAGFMEIGETPEETIAREVREEVGIEVTNIRYVKSQSWPFPSQLMLGFFADYKSGQIRPDEAEIAEAHWYPVDDIPVTMPPGLSVAGQLIDIYRRARVA